jgi:hypothetical protein
MGPFSAPDLSNKRLEQFMAPKRLLNRRLVTMLLLAFTCCLPTIRLTADDSLDTHATYQQVVQPFLNEYCFECHDTRQALAGLRLDELGIDFLQGKAADQWHEVINAINSGSMPPAEVERRPDPSRSFAVSEWVGRELRRAEQASRMAGGSIVARRLNRDEYVNTVRDLLYLDDNFVATLKEDLPADGKAEGFDRLAAALFFDDTQLSAYIHLAGRIAEKAIVDPAQKPEVVSVTMDMAKTWRPAKSEEEIVQYQKDTTIPRGPDVSERVDRGVLFLQPQGASDEKEFAGLGSIFNLPFNNLPVTKDGYYRIRIKAGAFRGARNEPIKMQYTYLRNTPLQTQGEIEVQGTLENPDVVETVVFLRQPPEGAQARLSFGWNGLFNAIIQNPEYSSLNLRRLRSTGAVRQLITANAPQAEIDAAKMEVEKLIDEARRWAALPDSVARIYNPKYELAEVPRLLVEWIEFAGPIEQVWPPRSHTALCSDPVSFEPAVLHGNFKQFLSRAYRRPVTSEEVDRLLERVLEGKDRFNLSALEAIRYGLQTVLSSPEFLLLFEPSSPGEAPRPVNDFEFANRLSYFLWSTMPDEELRAVAAAGRLHTPAVWQAQVSRMLADPRAREFAENFAGQWLHVRDYESVMPANEYQTYDAELREASAEEPIAFFEEVTRKNLSILNFLASDFTLVNDRLAEFYGIAGVQGSQFRRVELLPEHNRGGVLTMAGLLTYLADGTRTLPVRRGAFILEEIFNDPPPPPPPNAGEIQPNVKGEKLTVRQRLEQHRSDPICASCHAKIDPLGLALENYDAIGAWRERQNGERFRSAKAPPIDVSGRLFNGKSFTTLAEFKHVLLEEKGRFARALCEKMLTYALGRPVGFTDHATIDDMLAQLKADDYRMQSLIMAVVSSEPFHMK